MAHADYFVGAHPPFLSASQTERLATSTVPEPQQPSLLTGQ